LNTKGGFCDNNSMPNLSSSESISSDSSESTLTARGSSNSSSIPRDVATTNPDEEDVLFEDLSSTGSSDSDSSLGMQ